MGFTRTIMLKLVRWLNTSFWRCWKRAEFWNQQSNKHLTRWLASYSMWRWKGSHLSFCLPGGFQFSSFSSETANLRLWLDNLNPFWVLNLFLCNFFFFFWHLTLKAGNNASQRGGWYVTKWSGCLAQRWITTTATVNIWAFGTCGQFPTQLWKHLLRCLDSK